MDKINDRVHLPVSGAHLLLTYTGPLHVLLLLMRMALPASFTWLYLFLSFGFQWGHKYCFFWEVLPDFVKSPSWKPTSLS